MSKPNARKWILIAVGAGLLHVILVAGAAWYGWYVLTTRHAVRALPWSASDVQEHYVDSGFPLYDYTYKMKARMPEEEFPAYVRRLGLPRLKRSVYWNAWDPGNPPWWDPSASMSNTYGYQEQMVKWEKGFVYYISWCS